MDMKNSALMMLSDICSLFYYAITRLSVTSLISYRTLGVSYSTGSVYLLPVDERSELLNESSSEPEP